MIAGTEIAQGRPAEAASLLRPAIEQLQLLKDEGKLEGQPNYVQYIQFWKGDLAYYEAAPLALKDLDSVRSHPSELAIKLLRLRARTLKGREDRPGLIATIEAVSRIPCHATNELIDLAAFYAECIRSLGVIQSAAPSGPDNSAVRSRCTTWDSPPYPAPSTTVTGMHPPWRRMKSSSRSVRTGAFVP